LNGGTYGRRAEVALPPDKDFVMQRRINALPSMLVDFSLIAGLAATGMMLVFGLIYVTTALGRVDPFLL
jgi:hypothetical protein